MKRKIYKSFIALLLISVTCAGITEICRANTSDDKSGSVSTDTADGRYSNNSDSSAEESDKSKEILAAPKVEEFENRKLNLPDVQIEEADQTVTMMIYMIGSDLESKGAAATNDMQEMLDSGVDLSKVNLLIYTGGCENWYGDISSEKNAIYQLTNDGFTLLEEYDLKSMGESDTLSGFLEFSYAKSKTDVYNLILWDHGNGPVMGYGKDRLFDGDSMTLPELKDALSASPFNEENKLGFLGCDACLMSSAELACTVADYAEYLIASQEVEPNFGWNYSFLQYCGSVDNATLAKLAVHDYITGCNDYFSEHENFCSDVTLACMDLQYAGELTDSINALFDEAINDVSGSYNMLALERYNTRALGRATTGSEYDLVDLNSLMNSMGENYESKASEVRNVLDKMVCYSGDNTVDCCGMSIYYPYFNKKFYSASWKEEYKKIDMFPSYGKYLDSFAQVWMGTDMMALFNEPLTPEEYQPGSFSLTLSDEQLEAFLSAGYYLLRKDGDGVFSLISYSADVTLEENVLKAEYDGKVLMVSDDYGRKIPLDSTVTDIIGDDYYHSIDIKSKRQVYDDTIFDSDSLSPGQIQLIVDHNTNRVDVAGFYELSEDDTKADGMGTGKKNPLNTEKRPIIVLARHNPLYPIRDDNGVLLPVEEWLDSGIVSQSVFPIENGLHFSYEPFYDDGYEYFLMFDIIDTQAHHYCSELMPIVLAKGEKQEEAVREKVDYSWVDYDEPVIINNSGVDITFFEGEDFLKDYSDVYGLRIDNNNDFPISVKVKDVLINDEYEANISRESGTVFPHNYREMELYDVEKILRFSGEEALRNIRFSYRVINSNSGKILSDWTDAEISVDDSIVPKVCCVNFRGMKAMSQILLDDGELTVELLDCGDYLGTCGNYCNRLRARLKVLNKSDSSVYLEPSYFIINGIRFYLAHTVYSSENQYLEPGEERTIMFESGSLGQGIDFDRISSLEIVAKKEIEGTYEREDIILPVVITDTGEGKVFNLEDYPVVYEDDAVKVYDYGETWDIPYSQSPHYRTVIVYNKTENELDIQTEDFAIDVEGWSEEGTFLKWIRLEKGESDIISAEPPDGMTGEAMTFTFTVSNRDTFEEYSSDFKLESLY